MLEVRQTERSAAVGTSPFTLTVLISFRNIRIHSMEGLLGGDDK